MAATKPDAKTRWHDGGWCNGNANNDDDGEKHLVMNADEHMNKNNDDHGHDSNTRTRSSLQGSHNVSYNNTQA